MLKGLMHYHVNEVTWRITFRGMRVFAEGTNGMRHTSSNLLMLLMDLERYDKHGEAIK